ncbi:Fructose-bisphosphate aldolase class-I [Popillia japonica]|uniref:fructose-bisphosphate aldolase n=1 Tax=Popillia japonica TaxID=7064 RepID=A0AAW1MTZ6_POPJA
MIVIVPVIPFLSGGQSEGEATVDLDSINKYEGKNPWALTFSYGHALQVFVLKAWAGKDENISAAQQKLMKRSKANYLAAPRKYDGSAAAESATQSFFIADKKYCIVLNGEGMCNLSSVRPIDLL